MTNIIKSLEETKQLASQLAQSLEGGDVLALQGELGAGKTTFARNLIEAMGISQRVTSPTYVLLREYPVEIRSATLYHADLYRLTDAAQVEMIGLLDYLGRPDAICLIEWPELIKPRLPEQTKLISFEILDESTRTISIT